MTLIETTAREIAERKVSEMAADAGIALTIVGTTEIEQGWVFFYDSVEFLRTSNFSERVAGNGPIFVARTGIVKILPTAIAWQTALEDIVGRA